MTTRETFADALPVKDGDIVRVIDTNKYFLILNAKTWECIRLNGFSGIDRSIFTHPISEIVVTCQEKK